MNKKTNKTCIYCKNSKEEKYFNREHVVSRLFGSFEKNMTLGVVCTECNNHFSKNLELPLGRDSFLGLYRFLIGSGNSSTFNEAIKYKRKRVEPIVKSEEHGEFLIDINWQFDSTIASQICIISSNEKQATFRTDQLPVKKDLESLGLYPIKCIKLVCPLKDIDLAVEKFNAAFDTAELEIKITKENFLPFELKNEKQPIYIRNIIDENFAIALSKIVFNYFAHEYENLILSESFNDIRSYIRYSLKPGINLLLMEKKEVSIDLKDTSRNKHANIKICLYQEGNAIIGEVIIFDLIRLKVFLSYNYPILGAILTQGHIFDIHMKTISKLEFK